MSKTFQTGCSDTSQPSSCDAFAHWLATVRETPSAWYNLLQSLGANLSCSRIPPSEQPEGSDTTRECNIPSYQSMYCNRKEYYIRLGPRLPKKTQLDLLGRLARWEKFCLDWLALRIYVLSGMNMYESHWFHASSGLSCVGIVDGAFRAGRIRISFPKEPRSTSIQIVLHIPSPIQNCP